MLKRNLAISRPRFWLYLLGPFLIGVISADTTDLFWPALAVFAFYFTYPANLLIYGVNDLFDYETDQHNPKKLQYEELVTPAYRPDLLKAILLWNIPFMVVWLADTLPLAAKIAFACFLFFGIFYSMPPIRAKTKPVLDSLFNLLYVFPGVFAYGLLERQLPPPLIIAAAGLWCMAMHAYSAIPDIEADKQAGIRTIATWLRARGTLVFCLLGYLGAAALSYPWLGWFSLATGGLYALLMLVTFVRHRPTQVFGLYRLFPYVNMVVGIGLFYWIATVVK